MKKNLLEKIKEHKAPTGKLPVMYIITSSIEKIECQDVLFISFWDQKKMKAQYKLYIKGKEYITQVLQNDGMYKWSVACVNNIIGYHYGHIVTGCDNSEDKSRIEDYLNTGVIVNGNDIYNVLERYQQNIMDERLQNRYNAITNKIDAVMDKVPALPENFVEWVYNGPFDHSRYIYYKRSGKNITCFCTECKKEYVLRENEYTKAEIKHNNSGICSECGNKIHYKALGITKRLYDRMEFAILQQHVNGLLVRYFSGSKSYYKEYKNPSLYYHEKLREIYSFNGGQLHCISYEYAYFRGTGKVRWCDDRGKISVSKVYLYNDNIKEVIKETKWKYSCLYELAQVEKVLYLSTFLKEYLEKPAIEYLIKLKLYKLVSDNINTYSYDRWKDVNFRAKNITEFLKIDKSLFYQMQRLNLGIQELKLIKSAYSQGVTLYDEQLAWVRDNKVDGSDFIDMMKYTTPHKIIRYVKEQSKPGFSADDVISDWHDYIQQCKQLKYDLNNTFVLFPKNLREKHEECSLMIKSDGLKKYAGKVIEAYNILKETISFENKKFLIRPVASVDEIVKEGHMQRHCVAGVTYVEGMAKGNIAIMIIREVDKPNKPFYTMELNLRTMKVAQCRGYKNCDMTNDVQKFVDKWTAKKLNNDKKLKSIPA